MFGYLDQIYAIGFFPGFSMFVPLLYLILFILVLVAGYVRIFSRLPQSERIPDENPAVSTEKQSGKKTWKTWEDVGVEFRGMLYDAFHRMREEINRK